MPQHMRLSRREQRNAGIAVAIGLFVLAAAHAGSSTGSPAPAQAAAAPVSVSGNVALGQQLARADGWGSGPQWNCLYDLWQRESGWSNTAENPSDAYGIAQALGHGPTNQYPAGPANPPTSSASAQITWGLSYIGSTYGTPCGAWDHEEADSWY
jgi:resuscitation-promoting factor RpfB